MTRIAIVTATHVATSPRVWREADALVRAGHEVTVVGAWVSDETAAMDEALAVRGGWRLRCAADLRPVAGSRMRRLASRLRRRGARELWRLGIGSIDAMVYSAGELLRAARSTPADLCILHVEAGLWIGRALAAERRRIAIDCEDWYSEHVERDQTAAIRYLRSLERSVLPLARYCSAPSRAMAEELARTYRIPVPVVLYNGDPSEPLPLPEATASGPMRLLWFSQTLGLDRGLDDALRALSLLGDRRGWELDLLARSVPAVRAALLQLLPAALRARVRFLDLVAPEQLGSVCARYDVGLALEQKINGNRELTTTNKILRYAQSGTFVAATATAGQSEVLDASPKLGRTYPLREPERLAAILAEADDRLAALRASRQERAAEANRLYAYEAQAPKLLEAVAAALRSR